MSQRQIKNKTLYTSYISASDVVVVVGGFFYIHHFHSDYGVVWH
jgi:hypothetical protein